MLNRLQKLIHSRRTNQENKPVQRPVNLVAAANAGANYGRVRIEYAGIPMPTSFLSAIL